MYKLMLCWRYLRTRYIALASIVSVTLGVATMIVVNAVMAGFAHEMQSRIHAILSDVMVESMSLNGFYDPDSRMKEIEKVAGQYIDCMTPTVTVPSMLSFRYGGEWHTRPVTVVGIPEGAPLAAEYSKYLLHPEHRKNPDFQLKEDGYDVVDHQGGKEGARREELGAAGWQWRRWRSAREKSWQPLDERVSPDNPLTISPERNLNEVPAYGATAPNGVKVIGGENVAGPNAENEWQFSGAPDSPYLIARIKSQLADESYEPFHDRLRRDLAKAESECAQRGIKPPTTFPPSKEWLAEFEASTPSGQPNAAPAPLGDAPGGATVADNGPGVTPNDFAPNGAANPFGPAQQSAFDPATMQDPGCVVGYALCSYRGNDKVDHYLALPGDDVKLTLPTAGTPPRAADASFTVVDFYESKMNEYDSNFVFVPLRRLQEIRGMIDPSTDKGAATAIQIKLKNPEDGAKVRDLLRESFSEGVYGIYTWRDKQGPLLAAVEMETAILNVLLFMIIAVAGFGILAIFYMIVVEKTRDIGILKSLGASASGVMGVFVGYGVSLGTVGAGVGVVLGLTFVHYINEIADGLGWLTGREVFDPTIYYFYEIPAIIEPFTVCWIAAGAVLIAVTASILPARRAALLHPVEALRYE